MLAWEKLKLPPLQVAINVSAQQFLNGDIVRVFSEMIKQSGVDPGKIQIEITESAFIDRDKTVFETLKCLKQLGFTIALDDFGTGYSSLSSLKRFPLDVIKIDRSFIQDLTTDLGSSSGIINAIVLMAKSLMLKVIAEGVETRGQLAKIRQLNCDGIQGFLFSRPVSAEVVAGLFARHNGILHEGDQPFELRR
jgi:EAL domain-containing protein (putative c-di-GMP-specific phosphodiesterase class I)